MLSATSGLLTDNAIGFKEGHCVSVHMSQEGVQMSKATISGSERISSAMAQDILAKRLVQTGICLHLVWEELAVNVFLNCLFLSIKYYQ